MITTEESKHRYYLEEFYIPQTDISIQSNPEDKEELFTLRYNSSSTHIAGGYSSGRVGIFDIKENKYIFTTISEFPITCLRWKPQEKTTLLTVSADGNITQLHSTSGKILQKIEEEKNHIMCVDYSSDGLLFATGGNDKIVRLYDDNTKTLISTLDTLFYQIPKHDNRIFSVKFNSIDTNMLLSGGWDNTVKIYDIRQKGITNSLYGPHICGDGIDIKGTMMLTASWEKKDQIQIWDLRKMEIVNGLQIEYPSLKKSTYLYSCKFNYQKKLFGVTGSNLNSIRVYRYEKDIDNKNEDFTLECHCSEIESPCYSIDFSGLGNQIAYGCADSMIRLVSIK